MGLIEYFKDLVNRFEYILVGGILILIGLIIMVKAKWNLWDFKLISISTGTFVIGWFIMFIGGLVIVYTANIRKKYREDQKGD